jgi:tetratricopeptide (TPR) repeat protein
VSPQLCHSVQQLGSAWLGWIALANGDRPAASRWFENSDAPEWKAWALGRQAYEARNYRQAAIEYGRAIGLWRAALPSSLNEQLNPRPEMSQVLADWGGVQLASGDAAAALTNLDASIKADKGNARAYYLRGLAEQRSGRADAATQDFDLASRAALAETGADSAARAHFYRGIVFYRRKEFQRAEDEFASSMNSDVPGDWRADARAWRLLAAVAGGSCGASRQNLSRAEGSASPYFPKQQADSAMAACPVTAAESPAR